MSAAGVATASKSASHAGKALQRIPSEEIRAVATRIVHVGLSRLPYNKRLHLTARGFGFARWLGRRRPRFARASQLRISRRSV